MVFFFFLRYIGNPYDTTLKSFILKGRRPSRNIFETNQKSQVESAKLMNKDNEFQINVFKEVHLVKEKIIFRNVSVLLSLSIKRNKWTNVRSITAPTSVKFV